MKTKKNQKRVASAVTFKQFPVKNTVETSLARSSSLGNFSCRPLTATNKRILSVNSLFLIKKPEPKQNDLNNLLLQNSSLSCTTSSNHYHRQYQQFYLKSDKKVAATQKLKDTNTLNIDYSLLKLPLQSINMSIQKHLKIFTTPRLRVQKLKNSMATTNLATTERQEIRITARQYDQKLNTQQDLIDNDLQSNTIDMKRVTFDQIIDKQIVTSPTQTDKQQSQVENQLVGFVQVDLDKKQKRIEMNPDDLKQFYEELSAAHFNLQQLQQSNDKFFAELFDDGKFEEWLKVDKFSLCDKELQYVIDAFTLKQQLIDQGQDFTNIDFEILDDILHKLAFFERFTKSTRINILKLATYSMVPAGEYVFYQGDYGDNLYVILKGSVTVKISKEFEKGLVVQQVVSSLYDGQHFGELAMLETKQKEEEEVLEEKLEDLNVNNLGEVKKQLFQLDMKTLEEQSKLKKNLRMQELKFEGFFVFLEIIQDPQKLQWLNEETKNEVREYRMNIVTESASPTKFSEKDSIQMKSNIQYEKVNKKTQQRTASIQASESLHLISIGRENFKNILMVLMQDELELKIRILKSLRFFKDIQPFVLIPLANQLIHNIKNMDEIVAREGDQLEYMHILYKGSCKVIRTIITKRSKRPLLESKGAIVALPNFKSKKPNLPKEDSRRFQSHNTYLMKQNEDLIPDIQKIEEDEQFQIYENAYIYKKLYPGDIIFGRALTGKTLEGLDGSDTARMTIVSSSNKTHLYSLSPRLLSFCPDFLKDHLLNYLVTMIDVDKIQPQPLNKEIKFLANKLEKPKNMSEAEKKMNHLENIKLREQKKQEEELLKKINQTKRQKESKQDVRNKEWELYKTQLSNQVLKEQASGRFIKNYKKY